MTTSGAVAVPLPMEGDDPIIASFVHLADPGIVEVMGTAGLDAVLLDLEHGAYGIGELPGLVRAADAAGIPVMVRVSTNDPAEICKVLDLGVASVLVPQIEGPEAARRAVSAARYSPDGTRGAYPYSRSAHFGATDPVTHAKMSNDEQLVALLLEGADATGEIDEILGTEPDLVFFGPMDLSHALGVPGEIDHPKVIAAVSSLVGRCRTVGCATGVFAVSPAAARRWVDLGVKLIAVSVDGAVLLEGYRSLIADCR